MSLFYPFLLSFIPPFIVGGFSGYLSAKNVLWFMSLLQSKYTPSRKTYKIMWPCSYMLMSLSSYIIWTEEQTLISISFILYFSQLFINSFYCPLFFGLKRLDLSFLNIILLDIVLGICIFRFFQVSVVAGILMIPYYLWVLFNTFINADFYRLQEGVKRDPVYFTTNYSPHYLYQSTLEKKQAKLNNTFYSSIPNSPKDILNSPTLQTKTDKLLRYRFEKTPDSLYIQ